MTDNDNESESESENKSEPPKHRNLTIATDPGDNYIITFSGPSEQISLRRTPRQLAILVATLTDTLENDGVEIPEL